MAPRCSWDGLFHRALQIGLFRGSTVKHLDMGAGLESGLAVDDHRLIGFEARSDESLALADLPDRDGAYLHRLIVRDHVHIGALRPLLHGSRGDRQSVLLSAEKE